MSAAPTSGAAPAPKPAASNDKSAPPSKDGKPAAALEEDDEFEDFPVESMPPPRAVPWRVLTVADWTKEETEVPGDNTHLWEESWDDDDTSEDFSAQLKYVP
jgi:26 proteasome complex subunit DSS1